MVGDPARRGRGCSAEGESAGGPAQSRWSDSIPSGLLIRGSAPLASTPCGVPLATLGDRGSRPLLVAPSGTVPDLIRYKNGFEHGAAWILTSQTTGAEYVSVSLSAAEFGSIYTNLANAPGDDPSKKVLIRNPPS